MNDNGGSTRRDMLKKSAVAGAVAWTAPTVVSSKAFAAGSLSTNLCRQGVKPRSITYRWDYTGAQAYQWSVCTADGGAGVPGNRNAGFSGSIPGGPPTATVSATRILGAGQNGGALSVSTSTLSFGQTFTVSGTLDPNTRITLTWSIAGADPYTMTYHLSCSDPLCFGDQHGAFTVVSYTVG